MSTKSPDDRPDQPRFTIISEDGTAVPCDRDEFIAVVGALGEQGLIPALRPEQIARIQAIARELERKPRNPLDHAKKPGGKPPQGRD